METLKTKHLRFSEYELDGVRRVLLRSGKPVGLNPKAFDLLLVMVEARGEVLTKDELLDRVWPGQFVEEGNLKVHISALRKALGEHRKDHRFIVTVPGRGYSFVAPVSENAGGDIVIQKHSLSRIVIDEEITDHDGPINGHVAISDNAIVRTNRFSLIKRNWLLLSSVVVLAAVATLGIGYALIRWSRQPAVDAGFSEFQIKRLTANGKVSFAALSPDGKLFAYALKELEQNSLWLGFVEGGEDRLLRPSETGRYNDLAFSADGNSVLFTFSGADSRESVLYRMPAFGGPREKIRGGVISFAVAPDGEHYAFTRRNPKTKADRLVVARFSGDEESEIAAVPDPRSIGSESISWSQDGSMVAFGATVEDNVPRYELFIVTTADGSVKQVTTYGWKELIKTAWTDDGSGVLMVAQEKDVNTAVSYSQIWHVSFPGGEARQLTHDLSSYRSVLNASDNAFLSVELRQMNNIWVAPSDDLSKAKQVTFGTFGKYDGVWGLDWSTDGKIVFTSTDHLSQVVCAMNPDGTNVQQLTPSGYKDSMVNTSNDGRYIVFQSTRSGGSDIWRMDSDGGNVLRLTSDGKSSQPFISPDGRFVYFTSNASDSRGLHRVSIDGGQTEKLTDAEVSYLSLSPDGKRIAAGLGNRIVVLSTEDGLPDNEFELTRFGTPSGNTRWAPDGKAIAYRDRNYGYWLQPIDGGEPQRMKGLPMEKFYNFAWSKDGKQFAFVRGQEIRDVVLFRRTR